jgi:hypothetical protein
LDYANCSQRNTLPFAGAQVARVTISHYRAICPIITVGGGLQRGQPRQAIRGSYDGRR